MSLDKEALYDAADPRSDTMFSETPTDGVDIELRTDQRSHHSFPYIRATVKIARQKCDPNDSVTALRDTNHTFVPDLQSALRDILQEHGVSRLPVLDFHGLENADSDDESEIYVFEREFPIHG